jgi:polyhydroxybutyrate depolymerase
LERRTRRIAAIVAAVVLAGAVAAAAGFAVGRATRDDGAGTTTTTPTAEPPASSTTAGQTPAGRPDGNGATVAEVTIQQGIIQRQYLVMTPEEPPADPMPVVVVLHGLGFDRFGISKTADWSSAVVRDDFMAVFPQGVLNSWNAGPCCPPASLVGADDVAFLDQVVTQLEQRPDVDADRLYLTGFSNGAIMTYALACARPTTFAAVAPIAGTNLTGCSPSSPVSLLHLHGDPDPVVPYDGAVVASQLLSSADFPPVADSVAAWARADGCPADPEVTEDPGPVTRTLWDACDGGSRVELVTYPGNGHNWPTGPVDGIEELLRFFDIG